MRRPICRWCLVGATAARSLQWCIASAGLEEGFGGRAPREVRLRRQLGELLDPLPVEIYRGKLQHCVPHGWL